MMTEVRCSTHIPDVPDLPQQELSVGRHFYLNCEGTWDRSFDFSKAQLAQIDYAAPILRLFKAEARDIQSFEVDLTLYQAGQVQIKDLVLTDGIRQLSLGPQSFQVASKIQKQTDPSADSSQAQTQVPGQPQPFGYKYFDLQWPVVYTVLMAAAIVLVVLLSSLWIYRKNKMRQLIKRLKDYDSALDADTQFYREIRRLEKQSFPVQELKNVCLVYIIRAYQIPIYGLNHKQAIRFFKRHHPQHKDLRRQLYQMLTDLDIIVAKNQPAQTQQFVQNFYRFVDKTQEIKERGGFL